MPAIAPPDSPFSVVLTADESSRSVGPEGGAEGGSDERDTVGGWVTETPKTAVASSAVASFLLSLAASAMAVVARSSLATTGGVMVTWRGQRKKQSQGRGRRLMAKAARLGLKVWATAVDKGLAAGDIP